MVAIEPPKRAMRLFIWVTYAVIILFVLLLAEQTGMASEWQPLSWSWVRWTFLFALITLGAIGLYLLQEYFLDAWCASWLKAVQGKLNGATLPEKKKEVKKSFWDRFKKVKPTPKPPPKPVVKQPAPAPVVKPTNTPVI